MRKIIFGLNFLVFILFVASSGFAQKKLTNGIYKNFFSAGVFSLRPPDGFYLRKNKEMGAVFINTEEQVSVEIQCTNPSDADPEIFERLRDGAYQESFVEGLNRISARQYTRWELQAVGEEKVFEVTSIDDSGRFNPTRSLLFQKGGREFLMTLGTETPDKLDTYNYVLDAFMAALQTR